MKKLTVVSALIVSTFCTVSQTPKKPVKKAGPRTYNGCITRMDSILRKSSWIAIDSMKVRGYIVD